MAGARVQPGRGHSRDAGAPARRLHPGPWDPRDPGLGPAGIPGSQAHSPGFNRVLIRFYEDFDRVKKYSFNNGG